MGKQAGLVSVLPPTFEHHHDGFGVQCSQPRISWRFSCVDDQIKDWQQLSYDVEVGHSDEKASQVFSFESAQSVLVPWPCPKPLGSQERCRVRVRCHGRCSGLGPQITLDTTDWSPWSVLEVSLLSNSDWTARMITIQTPWPLADDRSAQPLCFRKSFELPFDFDNVDRARLYITSHGVYKARLNGRAVGNDCLSPGWQSYHKRLHYQLHDVTDFLKRGEPNYMEIEVAAGWFASACSWAEKRFIYGDKLGVMAQLEVWARGSPVPLTICSDESWSASTTSLVCSELYNGEICDKRLGTAPGLEDGGPVFAVQESSIPVSRLVCPEAAPIRVINRLEPAKILSSRTENRVILDFGQNIGGRVCVRHINKPSGSVITFRHAEVMQDGDIMVQPLRSAQARDILICNGTDILDWHPEHTFHGFRYVEVTGWGLTDEVCPLTRSSIVAEVLHTDMVRTGWFSCSNEQVNRLHENALWGMKSNFLSVPLECPSRDERFGWTGDLNIIAPTANFLHDTSAILRHWLDDLYLDQMDPSPHWRLGVVPLFVPNCMLRGPNDDGHAWDPMPNAVWGDAAIMVPWALYCKSGDKELLSRQYDSMVQWLELGVVRGEDNLWSPDQWQFGDWLDPRAPQNDSGRGTTDGTFVADCFLIAVTRIMANVARILGRETDADNYAGAALKLASCWQDKYMSAAGFIVPDTATALALALALDLVPESAGGQLRSATVARLCRNVRFNDFKITSGFVGAAYLARALTRYGESAIAYAMLFQKKCPSYLYPVTMGATTTWERWDSMLPDGTVNPGSMTSFNHHALGSIAHWLHADVGGLEAIDSGWKRFKVCPQPNEELAWVETAYESPYGRLEVRWTLQEGLFRLRLRVPANCSAIVILPHTRNDVSDNRASLDGGQVVGSGLYTFECAFAQANWPPQPMLPPWGRAEF